MEKESLKGKFGLSFLQLSPFSSFLFLIELWTDVFEKDEHKSLLVLAMIPHSIWTTLWSSETSQKYLKGEVLAV